MTEFQKNNTRASKLLASEVRDIRTLYARGDCSQGQLSRDFGVSVIQIGRIVRGEVWQHLPTEISARELDQSAKRLLELQQTVEAPGLSKLASVAEEQFKANALVDELAAEPAVAATRREVYSWLKKEPLL